MGVEVFVNCNQRGQLGIGDLLRSLLSERRNAEGQGQSKREMELHSRSLHVGGESCHLRCGQFLRRPSDAWESQQNPASYIFVRIDNKFDVVGARSLAPRIARNRRDSISLKSPIPKPPLLHTQNILTN